MMPYDVVSVVPVSRLKLAVRFADGLSGEVVLEKARGRCVLE